jgi:ABC-type branched-subunit amino acid transport system ATPase component
VSADSALLEVADLNAAYGEAKVLFDISLTVAERQIVTCVGRNGAGKTTLLKCIAGFVKPTSGTVQVRSASVLGEPAHALARRGIKYVPQDKKVFSDLTVRENLELGSYATRDYDWDRVLTYFPKLGAMMERKAGHLSGGERQMLMIGRAILGRPLLLLVDEPTEGLAPSIVAQLREVFKDLARRTALVIVEQNLPLVCAISDKVYALREGRIVTAIEDRQRITPAYCEQYV